MNEQALWIIILGGMLVTYGLRLSFIALMPPERLPSLLRRGLRFVPPAILAALITPEFFRPSGALDLRCRITACWPEGLLRWSPGAHATPGLRSARACWPCGCLG